MLWQSCLPCHQAQHKTRKPKLLAVLQVQVLGPLLKNPLASGEQEHMHHAYGARWMLHGKVQFRPTPGEGTQVLPLHLKATRFSQAACMKNVSPTHYWTSRHLLLTVLLWLMMRCCSLEQWLHIKLGARLALQRRPSLALKAAICLRRPKRSSTVVTAAKCQSSQQTGHPRMLQVA
jgi:hypothetical protein